MEIKPNDKIVLTPPEARWISWGAFPEELRRRAERERRKALQPHLPADIFEGVGELPFDTDHRDVQQVIRALRAGIEMQELEEHLLEANGGTMPHIIEMEASEEDVTLIYHHATHMYRINREDATDFSNYLNETVDAHFREHTFNEKLEDMQMLAGIIAAIERVRRDRL